MKKLISLATAITLLATSMLATVSINASADEVIKIACVGDSITGGNPGAAYPEYLQNMLGDGYEVMNFGKGGAGVGHREEEVGDLNWGWGTVNDADGDGYAYFYYDDIKYTSSLEYDADYVFVMMGTNDLGAEDFSYFKPDYYNYLVKPYLDNGSQVIIMTSPTAYSYMLHDHNVINTTIRDMQIEIAEENDLTLIDMNTATANRYESFPDGVHGNTSGYMLIAQTIYKEFFGGTVHNLTFETGISADITLTDDNPLTYDYVLRTDENGHGYIPVLPGTYTATIEDIYIETVEGIVVDKDTTVDFAFSSENQNLAIGATATVDSVNTGYTGHDAVYVNDGNVNTRWQTNVTCSEETPAWVYLDFGSAITFDTVTITWETARAASDGYVLQYSDDAENWVNITDSRERDNLVDPIVDLCRFNAVTARYVRVYCTKPDSDKYNNPSIWELEVYNTTGEGEIPTPPADDVNLGDVNGDGDINSTDFMQIRRYYLGLYTFSDEQLIAADVNKDGDINSTDFMQVRRHFLGLFTIVQ